MQLSRIHGQRLCDDCADRADRASGSHPAVGSGSGRVPSASGPTQAVSKGPIVMVAAVAVVLVGVAVYFTVIAPGAAGSTTPSPTSPVAAPSAPAPVPTAPAPAPIPAPIKRPEDITIQGTLQPFNRTASGDVKQIEFVDAVNEITLVVTGTDRYVAEDLTPGKRYRVSFRALRSDTKTQEVKYSLDIHFEEVSTGG